MGWEDRDYYRDRPASPIAGPLGWVLYGSVPLFTAFGIRVRAHASLIVISVLVLLFGFGGFGSSVSARVYSITSLFAIILLHEFGHCFAARYTGGSANDILMTPLGGLAMAAARRRPWPTFFTVAGGPLVNVLLCLLCGAVFFAISGGTSWPLLPNQFAWAYYRILLSRYEGGIDSGPFDLVYLPYFLYTISYYLLLFNLLPVFPLDGGQLLQSILWKPMGYFRSMIVTLNIGLIGAALMIMVALATFGSFGGGMLLLFIAANCLMNCIQMRRVVREQGPYAFSDEDEPDGMPWFMKPSLYGGGYVGGGINPVKRKKGPGWFGSKRAAKAAKVERDEQAEIDAILAKVSSEGMQSLSSREKKKLQRATENQRKRDQERGRYSPT